MSDLGSYTSALVRPLSRGLLELNTNPANFACSYISYGMICSHYRNKNSIDALRKLLLSLSRDYFPLHQLYSRMYSRAVTGFQVFLSKNRKTPNCNGTPFPVYIECFLSTALHFQPPRFTQILHFFPSL